MIFDSLKNCEQYYSIHPAFKPAFDFIKKAVEENLEVGKYELDGKSLYASVQEYTTKLSPDGKFEGHNNYIDIQFIISGKELMEVGEIDKFTAKTEYNDVKDVTFYHDLDSVTQGIVADGEFGIFFPNDIHKPGMSVSNVQSNVKKIVVKVKL